MTGIGAPPGAGARGLPPAGGSAASLHRASGPGRPAAGRFLPRARVLDADRGPGASRFLPGDLRIGVASPVASEATGRWRAPDAVELRGALAGERSLNEALKAEGKTGHDWVVGLADAIAHQTPADGTAPGVEMVLRFAGAYGGGRVAHIALGTAWRAPDDTLRVAFLHQESLPDVASDGRRTGAFTGRFYGGFDTAADHADKVAPVVESMKLAGLPSVNVFSCDRPQSLPHITAALQARVGDHVYAPSPTWPGVKEGLAQGRTAYGTCFTASQVAHEALAGRALKFPKDHTTDQSLVALAPFACIDLAALSAVPVGRQAVPLDRIFANEQPVRGQQMAFLHLGERWGQSPDWQVQATRTTSPVVLGLEPGKRLSEVGGMPEGWSALQFGAPPKGLSLDGAAVRTGVTYSKAECDRMQVGEGGKARVVVGHPPEGPRARL